MRFSADLHIHSALSPCADDDMTPNNIVNMAALKGLDIIAVTDHNSALNLEAVSACARGKGLIVVPGIEVETREEVHLICLFPDVAAALCMQDIIYSNLPPIKNRENIFGCQLILNTDDEISGYEERMLVTAADLSIEEVFMKVKSLGGAVIPAHIDRQSYSIISNLGMIPEELIGIRYLELSKGCRREELFARYPLLSGYEFMCSSDAHHLWDISEREFLMEMEELSVHCLLRQLNEG